MCDHLTCQANAKREQSVTRTFTSRGSGAFILVLLLASSLVLTTVEAIEERGTLLSKVVETMYTNSNTKIFLLVPIAY